MSENTNLSEFSKDGLNIGKDNKVLSYLHGLSDFWVYMFEDASKVNLILESNAIQASDIYNKFLQLTSIISLEEISTLTNSQIKLVLVSTANAVPDMVETYYLSDANIKSARCIANRPFMPTVLLEGESDFHIDQNEGYISFARPLAEIGFPFRNDPITGTKEFALWAVDVKVDDQLIYKHYAKLLNIDPVTSTTNFKNFIYGLYYLYVNGPNLAILRKGLNITLGIPLARDSEVVLEIRKYLNTDQYLVITDLNSYLVPYGLTPTVEVGDTLVTGDEIAVWVEVKDYQSDGDWWINFMIPADILPHVPNDTPGRNRYATPGSYADQLMAKYLKTHTFLVNVKTVSFKNIQNFEQLSKIIKEVKPSYTAPLYVWTIPTEDETITIGDSILTMEAHLGRCEPLSDGIQRFERDSLNPVTRECPQFMRFSVNKVADCTLGLSEEINGPSRDFTGGKVTGFVGPQKGYRNLTDKESALLLTFRTRNQDHYQSKRGWLNRTRDYTQVGAGVGVNPYTTGIFSGYRMVYLHTSTLADVSDKFDLAGEQIPNQHLFTLFKPEYYSDLINEHEINGSVGLNYNELMISNFDYFFGKGYKGNYLGAFLPKDSYRVYKPEVTDILPGDFLAFTRVIDSAIGVYWITKNFTAKTIPYWDREGIDTLSVGISGKMTRGMAPTGAPFYQLRSFNLRVEYGEGNSINDKDINSETTPSTTLITTYEDSMNPEFVVDRSGRTLITNRTLR